MRPGEFLACAFVALFTANAITSAIRAVVEAHPAASLAIFLAGVQIAIMFWFEETLKGR